MIEMGYEKDATSLKINVIKQQKPTKKKKEEN
jgi:hypothetical protein